MTELNHLQITDLNTDSAEAKKAIVESNDKFALNIFKNGISEEIKPTECITTKEFDGCSKFGFGGWKGLWKECYVFQKKYQF